MAIVWREDGGVTLTEEEAQQFLYQIEHPDLEQLNKAVKMLELGRSITKNGNRIMNNWIDIRDELPECWTEVLVVVDGHRNPSWSNRYCIVAYVDSDGYFWEQTHESEYPLVVTHWMSLPDLPSTQL